MSQETPDTQAAPTEPVNEYNPGDVLAYVNPDALAYMTFVGLLKTALDFRDANWRVKNLDIELRQR